MIELIRYAVIGGFIGLTVYEIFSSKVKIDRLARVVENERSKINAVVQENAYLKSACLMRGDNSIERQIKTLERNMCDKDWLELNWEKTQARKEYEERLEQIDRVNKMGKGE